MDKKKLKNRKLTCSRCGLPKEENRIKQGYCMECANLYARVNRRTYGELTAEQKMKSNARSYLNSYLKKGKITKPNNCFIEGCPNTNLEAHHHDYSKPLDVVWLCKHHHSILTHLY